MLGAIPFSVFSKAEMQLLGDAITALGCGALENGYDGTIYGRSIAFFPMRRLIMIRAIDKK